MFADVVEEIVYLVNVVVIAVVPVAVQRRVPVELLTLNLALGNIVPKFAVFFIQRLNVSVEPDGITPAEFGSPACVSNSLMMYSAAALLAKLTLCMAKLVPSGFAV